MGVASRNGDKLVEEEQLDTTVPHLALFGLIFSGLLDNKSKLCGRFNAAQAILIAHINLEYQVEFVDLYRLHKKYSLISQEKLYSNQNITKLVENY